jgi:hypothetical protein
MSCSAIISVPRPFPQAVPPRIKKGTSEPSLAAKESSLS